MKLLDHTLTEQGYTVRIWLDEIAPDAIREYTWTPYQTLLTRQVFTEDGTPQKNENDNPIYENIPWEMTQKQYEQEHIDQAMKLATQELAQLQPNTTVVSQDKTALKAQEEAVKALESTDE